MRKASLISALVAVSATAFAAPRQSKDIVDVAVGAGKFKTLTKLVTEAGLVDALKSPGPFTVFAPTDAAFAKVPKPLLKKLLADKELLKKVLTYHVLNGAVYAKDVKTMKATTLSGETIQLRKLRHGVRVNSSRVIIPNVKASNGVIHAIDQVLIPPSLRK